MLHLDEGDRPEKERNFKQQWLVPASGSTAGTAAAGGDAHDGTTGGGPEQQQQQQQQVTAGGWSLRWRDKDRGAGTAHAPPVVAPVTPCHLTP